MMTLLLRAMAGLCLLGLLAGCGSSPPVRYYVLSAGESTAPGNPTPTVGVGPVTVPEYLNRDNLVTGREGNTLAVADSQRWAEPLQEGVRRVLALNIAGLLNTQGIRTYPWQPDQAPDFDVRVSLLSLDVSGARASLQAEWRVSGGGEPGAPRLSRLQVALPGGGARAEDIAAAYSALFFQLSEIIAASIASKGTGTNGRSAETALQGP
jgi:uncharacterized lipoprotein YmbA